MRRCFLTFVLGICALLTSSVAANASILSGFLSPDGITDLMEDDSRSGLIQDIPGPIVADDILFGVIRITSYTKSPATGGVTVPPPTVGIIFSATVVSGLGTPGSPWILGPTDPSSPYALSNLAPSLYALSNASSTQKDQSIFLIGSNAANVGTALLAENALGALQSVQDAATLLVNYEATGGLQPGTNSLGGTDFFSAQINSAGDAIDELGGFTVFDNSFGGVFDKPSIPALIGPPVVQPYQVYLTGTIRGISNSVYTFLDDARFYTNEIAVVPEPASFLVWCGVFAAACLAACRRSAA